MRELKKSNPRAVPMPTSLPPAPPSPTSPDVLPWSACNNNAEPESSASSPEVSPIGEDSGVMQEVASNNASPSISPRAHAANGDHTTVEAAPSVLPSPVLLANIDSPVVVPRHRRPVHSASPKPHSHAGDDHADADRQASAVLLMLNRESRQSIDDATTSADTSVSAHDAEHGGSSRKASMSVRDLLNS